jgi:hypothetical protein
MAVPKLICDVCYASGFSYIMRVDGCLINAVVRFGMFLLLVIMVRGMFKVAVPWRSIAKYVLASAVMGAVLFLLPYTNRISTTLTWTAVGGPVYFVLLMAIDKEARSLPKAVLQEIKGKKRKL